MGVIIRTNPPRIIIVKRKIIEPESVSIITTNPRVIGSSSVEEPMVKAKRIVVKKPRNAGAILRTGLR